MAEIPVESLIREAATSRGVDPDLAVRIAQKESSLYPKAKNPRSSAYGLFQITNDTWKEYGGTPENRYDMMDNIRIGMDIIASNRDTFLKKFGRAPSSGELYTMHMFGKTGGPRLMSQDPNALMADVVSPKIIKANRIPSTQTVGEFIASMQQKMGSKLDTMMAKRGTTEQKAGSVPTPKAPKETIKEKPVREPIIPLAEGEMRKRPLPDQRLSPLAQGEVSQDMIASLGPNYQAALGAMALGDTSEDDLDFDDDEALGDRYQRYVAEQDRIRLREMEDAQEASRPSALASLDLSYQSPFEQSPFEEEQPQAPVMLAHGGVVHRRDGSPIYGEMVPDSGPVTEDTRKALSTRQGLSAAEMMRMLKGVGSEGVSNLESLVRGQGAMLLGTKGDIESIFRSDEKRIFPTSDEVLKKFSTRATSPTREAEGFEAVGMYVPPPIPSSAVSTGAELIKQGANKVSSTAKNLLPKKQVIPEDLFPTRKLSSQELLKQLKEIDPEALERGKQAFLKDSAEKRRMYHGTRHSVGVPDIQVLEDGTIKQVYSDRHGFSEFKPRTADMTFLSPDPSFSETFAGLYKHASGEKYLPHGGTMYPVYAKVKKPFDYENLEQVKELADEVIRLGKKKSPNLANLYKTDPDFPFWATRKDYAIDALSDGSWATLENPIVIQAIKNLKYDGVYMKESGVKNLGVFDPKNIKSATGNIGTYDVKNPDIRKAHGGVVHRKDGSPIYGEVADSGPITEDTRIALSLPQGLSSAELMKLFKNVGKEGVSNLESLARGSVAAVPGLVGDIESIFRSDKERKFATTPEVERQYLPSRLTKPTKESAGFIEAGTFIDPTVGLKVAKPVAKGTAKAALAGFKSVSPQLENIMEKSALGLDKSYIVKPEGGNWLPDVRGNAERVDAVDDFAFNLLEDTGVAFNIKRNKHKINEYENSLDANTSGLARFEEEFSSSPAILESGNVFRRLIARDKELIDEAQGELDRSQSIANFIEKKLKPYVRNNLGTKSDQVRLNMDKWELEEQPKLIAEKQKQIDKVRADIDKAVAARGNINPLMLTNSQAQLRKLMNEMEAIKARTGSFAQFGGRVDMERLVKEDMEARNLGGLRSEDWRNRMKEQFGQLNWPALPIAGKSVAGKAWEGVVDKAMDVYTPTEAMEDYLLGHLKDPPAWLTKLVEAEKAGEVGKGIYSLSQFSEINTHFYHLIDELKSAVDPLSNLPKELRRTPKEIEKMSVEDASTLVDKINGWRASNASGLNLQRANNPAVFETKTYPTIPNTDIPNEKQLRWVEIKMPDNMPKEEGRRVLNDALKYEGELMRHCVGIYCPEVEKGTKVFSLRDIDGRPYATIEAVPDKIDPVADRQYLESVLSPDILRSFDNRDISEKELMSILKDRMAGQDPYMIKQIKGLSNGRPEEEVMPFIDDFVTDPSMNWSAINDIQNTNLRRNN